MKTFKPMGARLLVEEIITTLSLEERGKRAGLTIIVESENRPPATMGKVIAVGNDPLLKEVGIKEGDIVHFSQHAGSEQYLEGKQFRMLDLQEVIALEQESPLAPSDQEQRPDQQPLESLSH